MKLVLVDGFAVLHRAFHAIPLLTTPTGQPINAVYGLISMLLVVIQEIKPTHIVVCLDVNAKTFRREKFGAYQSQRPELAEGLSSQIAKAKKFLEKARIPFFEKEGYEADDLIGTLSQQFDGQVVIVTGDRDILQLVTEKIKVYMPVVGFSKGRLFGKNEVIERMGVPPSQIVDYKALVGDASDNYPGVTGIGPKTAISLLEKYKTLDNIYNNLDNIPEKMSNKLLVSKDNAYMAQTLATILKDVDVKLDSEASAKWDIDSPEIVSLFTQEFGFKTLTERVKKVGQELDQEKQGNLF